MSRPRRRLPPPGPGFALLVALLAASAAFLMWGLRRPPLDAVWQIEAELGLGIRPPLEPHERALLDDVLARYPAVASDFLDGRTAGFVSLHDGGWVSTPYAYLMRSEPGALRRIAVTPSVARTEPVQVCASVRRTEHCAEASGERPFVWDLPEGGPYPQLIELRLPPASARPDHRTWVRIDLEPAAGGEEAAP